MLKENTSKNAEMDAARSSKNKSLALDGGWGWVIVSATFVIGVIGNISTISREHRSVCSVDNIYFQPGVLNTLLEYSWMT